MAGEGGEGEGAKGEHRIGTSMGEGSVTGCVGEAHLVFRRKNGLKSLQSSIKDRKIRQSTY